jgi:hypothetical protein
MRVRRRSDELTSLIGMNASTSDGCLTDATASTKASSEFATCDALRCHGAIDTVSPNVHRFAVNGTL